MYNDLREWIKWNLGFQISFISQIFGYLTKYLFSHSESSGVLTYMYPYGMF